MRRLHKFLHSGRSQQTLLVRAALLVAGIRVALWLLPHRLILRLMLHCHARLRSTSPAVSAETVAGAVSSVSRFIPRATCLTQAIATRILLARMGVPSELRIGVARGATGSFEAHAWVDCEGRTIIGAAEPGRFVTLPDLWRTTS